jgi:hypothetical protein
VYTLCTTLSIPQRLLPTGEAKQYIFTYPSGSDDGARGGAGAAAGAGWK